MPRLYVVAGPNGCGKSTLTRTPSFSNMTIIDPDAIARSMGVASVQASARTALDRRRVALESLQSHLIETTLSGKSILRHVQSARDKGYMILLHYVSLYTAEDAIDRIRHRVRLGGHNIPKEDIRRRFTRSHANLPTMIGLSDEVYLYDNADPDKPNRIIGIFRDGRWWTDIPGWALAAIQKSPHFV